MERGKFLSIAKVIQCAVCCHSVEILLSKENNHKTRVISLGDWVSYHTLKIKLLIFKMKEVFSTDSYALFRYRLLSFYPDIRSEGNQKNQKKTE